MATNITGPYNGVSMPVTLAPAAAVGTVPASSVVGSAATAVAALADTSDSTYVYVNTSGLFRFKCSPTTLPAGARVTGAYVNVRANYVVNQSVGPGTTDYGSDQTSVFTLHAGETMTSPDGRFRLIMQGDGNLVLYTVDTGRALWSSLTRSNDGGNYAVLQADGNFVVYPASGAALWSTLTSGANNHIVLQADGNLVVYSSGGVPLWNSGTRVQTTVFRNAVTTGIGDYAGASKTYADNLPLTGYSLNYYTTGRISRATQTNSQGKLFTASDFANGLVAVFGAQGSDFGGPYRVTQAGVAYSYDEPPTAVVTYPAAASAVNDTARPTVTWDYTDDFAPQFKYRVTVSNGSAVVYDSGTVQSADTFHTLTSALPNGSYTVAVRVWQEWSGPGGDFPALAAATSSFSVAVAGSPAPALSATLANDHATLVVTPGLNLLSYQQSTQDRDAVAQTVTNASLARGTSKVRTGPGSMLLTTADTGTATVDLRPVVTVVPGTTYTAGFYAQQGSALAGRTAVVSLMFTDAAGSTVGTVAGSAVSLGATAWTRATVTAVAPAGAVKASLRLSYLGATAAGETVYFDDLGLWFGATAPAFAAGGFYDSTPNMLTYGQSSFEGTSQFWRTKLTSDTLALSSAVTAVHGNQALAVTSGGSPVLSVGMANTSGYTASAGLVQFPVDPTRATYAGVWVRSNGTGRTAKLVLAYAGQTVTASVTDSTTWQLVKVMLPPTPGVTSVGIYVEFSPASGSLPAGEVHYLDSAYVHQGGADLGSVEGFQDGDTAPTLTVEYTDDGTTWQPLLTDTFAQTVPVKTYQDYTLRSGVLRQYRASYSETVGGSYTQSTPSSPVVVRSGFQGVWLHMVTDPAGTVHRFAFDGGGRSRKMGRTSVLTTLQGRAHPFAEFGPDLESTVSVSVSLLDTRDAVALETFAQAGAEVVFRDGRGRFIQGVIDGVSFDDAVWGQTATFDITQTSARP